MLDEYDNDVGSKNPQASDLTVRLILTIFPISIKIQYGHLPPDLILVATLQ
jgi:hypothetical protein